MRLRRRLFALLGTAAVMLLVEGAFQPAEACSFPSLFAIVTSPAPGESNVPTNVVIDIVVFADPMPAAIVSLFTLVQMPSGFSVATNRTRVDSNTAPYMTTVRLTPIAYLDPNRNYEIRQETFPLTTFSTGSLPDTTAPAPPTGASATVNAFDSHPDGGSDCITDRIRLVHLNVPTPSKPVVYSVKEGPQVITSFDSNLTGSFYCSGQPHWQGELSWVISPGQHTVQLIAIDRAGNSSATVNVPFDASCAGGLDGGLPDGGGGNGTLPGDTSTSVQVQPSSGCSCGTGVSAAIALAGFATV